MSATQTRPVAGRSFRLNVGNERTTCGTHVVGARHVRDMRMALAMCLLRDVGPIVH